MAFAMGTGKYVKPPTITETTVNAYAHCPDPRCKGVKQEQVPAVRTLTEWTFESRGGGDDPGGIGNLFLPMVENSQEHLRFLMDGTDEHGNADPTFQNDLACPHCDKTRELSNQPRPSYPIMVGGANALLRLQDMGISFDPDKQEKIAAGAPESPTDLLQRRYINDEITDDEFAAKRSALSGAAPEDDRIAVLEAQLAKLLGTEEPPKRGPGRPRKEPDA